MALSRPRLALIIATICLAVMVVALGAAAKHSQFETAAHSTQYLKQSVKMVSGDHEQASLPRLVAFPLAMEPLVERQVRVVLLQVNVPTTPTLPLLI